MRIVLSRKSIRALVVVLPWLAAAQARGGELEITVTNNQPAGGFAISPVWIGVHDGTFKTFDPGAAGLRGHPGRGRAGAIRPRSPPASPATARRRPWAACLTSPAPRSPRP